MVRKLSLEKFISIKKQLQEIDESNYEFNITSESYKKYLKRHMELQNHLLSYDLSDIPFEEWAGVTIISDEDNFADFSMTRANIDFDILCERFDPSGFENFKGCNIRNLQEFGQNLHPRIFDERTINDNPKLFLSVLFTNKFKELYYSHMLSISDLVNLSNEQLEELKQKEVEAHLNFSDGFIVSMINVEKAVQLYNHSVEDYELVRSTLDYYPDHSPCSNAISIREQFNKKIKSAEVSALKDICYEYLRKLILEANTFKVILDKLPALFVKENSDILFTNISLPEKLKNRFYSRRLKFEDILENMSIFENIPIDNFLHPNSDLYHLALVLGYGNLQRMLKVHLDFIKHIVSIGKIYTFTNCFRCYPSLDLEENFTLAAKKYFIAHELDGCFKIAEMHSSDEIEKSVINYLPSWLASFNFTFVAKMETVQQLMSCDLKTIIIDTRHFETIETLGIDNIKKLEQKIGFFSHKTNSKSNELENFYTIVKYFHRRTERICQPFDFKYGKLPYEKFEVEFAKCLNAMRKYHLFHQAYNYDWISGEFREKYRDIFIDQNVPDILKGAFYENTIDAQFIANHPECWTYLLDKKLSDCIINKIRIKYDIDKYENFIDYYALRFGNEELLKLLAKYAPFCDNLLILLTSDTPYGKADIDRCFRDAITNKIIEKHYPYQVLENVTEYVQEHPDMFIDLSSLQTISLPTRNLLTDKFYNGVLSFNDIYRYPDLVEYLKNKNLWLAFREKIRKDKNLSLDLDLLNMYGNENFLKLCVNYGDYLIGVNNHLAFLFNIRNNRYIKYDDTELTLEELMKVIEYTIAEECIYGYRSYDSVETPKFLKRDYPELFLDDGAPLDLLECFYNTGFTTTLTFSQIKQHPEWVPYLKGKSVLTPLIRDVGLPKESVLEYFKVFGDAALKIGANKPETVTYMIEDEQVGLMKAWYDKTHQKFVPDMVVMQNFPLEEADKFLASSANWSTLMKISSFSSSLESRDAMLLLAYSFGVFDNDQKGFKKLLTLLTDIPRYLSPNYSHIVENNSPLTQVVSEILGDERLDMTKNYRKLNMTLKSEGVSIDDNEEILSQIYRKNADGSYTLRINPERCPKSKILIRNILDSFSMSPTLSPNKAHQLFGRFILKYDEDFREFLLANMEEILESPKYISLISSIQAQFSDIKALNSNRTLTLNLAASFVQSNRYNHVNPGNEGVAEISAIAGYSQKDFNVLQTIYNHGKLRTFSSIPRIEKRIGNYKYEILRLDDPLALAIGTLTDCCQELGNVAEACMEHSVVDKNGRVFVIKDVSNNIVTQSWVWRNRDVLCFDNIEIPNRAFARAKAEHSDVARRSFSDEIYNIYKLAALELIEHDEKVYSQLLESGKISQEQYDGLRLSKITVGLGYNDIAESLMSNSEVDTGKIARPLPFIEPVKLNRGLYINDSSKQYVLAQRNDRVEYDGRAFAIYTDGFQIYDDSNFNEILLLTLNKLEIVTKGVSYNQMTSVDDVKAGYLVTQISENYGLNPSTCKIIMNPNFAIIYQVCDNLITIVDLFFNTYINNKQQKMDIEEKVVMQIRLALEQIAKDHNVDTSHLNQNQKEIYLKAMNLKDEIDIESGFCHNC